MSKKKFVVIAHVLLFCAFNAVKAQNYTEFRPVDPIALDRNVKYGKLSNGLTYYIRNTRLPDNKISLNIVVKAGRIHEDKDQLGAAHLLEHMGFRSLRHFPEGIRGYLLSKGLEYGNDVNAWTGSIHTCFFLKIPETGRELLDSSFLILRDWTDGFQLQADEIKRESGAVISEIRKSSEAMREPLLENAKILHHRKYTEYDIDHLMSSYEHFNPEKLSAFYRKWYRADRQAIIIVGNIDVSEMERKVIETFSPLKYPGTEISDREIINDWSVKPSQDENLITIPRNISSGVDISIMRIIPTRIKSEYPANTNEYRTVTVDRLINEMLQFRLEAMSPAGESIHLSANIERSGIIKTAQLDVLSTHFQANGDSLENSMLMAMNELERLGRFGFDQAELARAKTHLYKTITFKTESAPNELVGKYINHFVFNAAAPEPGYEAALTKYLVGDITLEEINLNVSNWLKEIDKSTFVIKGKKKYIEKITKETIKKWVSKVRDRPIKKNDNTKMPELPLATPAFHDFHSPDSFIVNRHPRIGVTEYNLYGTKLVFKPSKNPDDPSKIYLRGVKPGGANLYRNMDYYTALESCSILNKSGVGGLTETDLKKILWGKDLIAYSYIDDDEVGVRGTCSSEDIETMLQLICLIFTNPNRSENEFNLWVSRKIEMIRQDSLRKASEVKVAMDSSNISEGTMYLKRLKFNRVYQIFTELFSNPNDFTFVFTGNIIGV